MSKQRSFFPLSPSTLLLHLSLKGSKPLSFFPFQFEEETDIQTLANSPWSYKETNNGFSVFFEGNPLFSENNQFGLIETAGKLHWNISLNEDPSKDSKNRFIGLGEKNGNLNKLGKNYVFWNTDAFAYGPNTDPLYASIPFFIWLKEEAKPIGFFLDFFGKAEIDFCSSQNRFFSLSVYDEAMAVYIFQGETISEIVNSYLNLTGFPPPPPLWALGLHQSRYSYFPDNKVIEIVQQYRSRNIPLDAIHLDIHHMDSFKSFTFHPTHFPNPSQLVQKLKENNIETVVIIDPGIKKETGYPPCDKLSENEVLLYPDRTPFEAGVWPGNCVFPDFLQPAVQDSYAKFLNYYSDLGIAGFWNDMNEPAVWGQKVPDFIQAKFRNQSLDHIKWRNLYGHSMVSATRKGGELSLNREEVWVLTRSAYAGTQKLAWIWTGDNVAGEEDLKSGIRLLLSLSLSGYAFCGMDVGGFVGDPSPELYAKWVSVAAFFPFFRIHSMIDSRSREPFQFGETIEAKCKHFIQLRYQLLPTLISTAMAHSLGNPEPIIKPLCWDHPTNETSFSLEEQEIFVFCNCIWVSLNGNTPKELPISDFQIKTEGLPTFGFVDSAIFFTQNTSNSTKEEPKTLNINIVKGKTIKKARLWLENQTFQNWEYNPFTNQITFDEDTAISGANSSKGRYANAKIQLVLYGFEGENLPQVNDKKLNFKPSKSIVWEPEIPHFDPFVPQPPLKEGFDVFTAELLDKKVVP